MHERIDPLKDGHVMELSRLGHINRYQKAHNEISADAIGLDAGCGVGYGTKLLAGKAGRVIGIDCSEEAIEKARTDYSGRNIDFLHSDLNQADYADLGPFDFITLFEVLEHMEQPDQLLTRLRSALKPTGKLFLSVPNGNNAPTNNHHHVNDFTQSDVESMLIGSRFEIIETLGQYPLLGAIAEIARKATGYNSDTDKHSGAMPKLMDAIPGLAGIFAKLYRGRVATATARTLYFVARPKT